MDRLTIRRTTSEDPDFIPLVRLLDQFLSELNGEKDAFYAQHNKLDFLDTVVLAFIGEEPVGCGAFRALDEGVEVKRMFVLPDVRGKGVGRAVLTALEDWSIENGHLLARLETSKRLTTAVTLYTSAGYEVIPNYGPYICAEDSVCFAKSLVRSV